MPNQKGNDGKYVATLVKGLSILQCFDSEHVELGSMEIADRTGLPQPTVWRLCYTLVQCGCLLQSDQTEKYRIGLGVLGLGYSAIWSRNRRELILDEMQKVATASGCAVSLAIPQKSDMLIVERATPQSLLIINLEVGSKLPVASSSMGWAYLAGLTEEQYGEELKVLRIARNKAAKALLDKARDQYQKNGFVINAGQFHRDINAVASPITLPDSRQVAAINCGGPASAISVKRLEKEIGPRIVALANLIKQSLIVFDFPLER